VEDGWLAQGSGNKQERQQASAATVLLPLLKQKKNL
jgi:hypothetical protein